MLPNPVLAEGGCGERRGEICVNERIAIAAFLRGPFLIGIGPSGPPHHSSLFGFSGILNGTLMVPIFFWGD